MSFYKLIEKSSLISFLFIGFLAEGLNSSYITMYMPEDWTCVNFPPNHICHPDNLQQDKKILILISASMGLKSDRLENYLKKPSSDVQEIRKLVIKSQEWLDFLPDSFSMRRYIRRRQVSICCDEFDYAFHARVGFYTVRGAYPEYVSLIVRMINSLEFKKRNEKGIEEMLRNQNPEDLKKAQDYIGNILSEDLEDQRALQKEEGGSVLWYLLFIPALALPVFIMIRRWRRKRRLRAMKRKLKRRRK